jgi:hypothetical protein
MASSGKQSLGTALALFAIEPHVGMGSWKNPALDVIAETRNWKGKSKFKAQTVRIGT